MTFEDLCKLGEAADGLCKERKYTEALAKYKIIIEDTVSTGTPDIFIVSKSVLGMLLALVRSSQIQEAFDLFTSDEESIHGIGIRGLGELFQTSNHDAITYYMVAAFLFSIVNDRQEKLAKSVQSFMERVLGYGFDADTTIIPMAISNWKNHIMAIFDGVPAPMWVQMIAGYEKKYGKTVSQDKVDFPAPSRWVIDWETGPPRTEMI